MRRISPLSSITAVLVALAWCAPPLHAQEAPYNVELLANENYAVGGERGNDIWGYVDAAGTEYAIAGSTQATYIYSLEDPTAPRLRLRIPGATSTWRDIKDHDEYLYVVADVGADGLLVIDMSGAPDAITYEFYKPDVAVGGDTTTLEKCHNLYVSEEGYAVLTGCNVYSGTPLFFDLNADPEQPPFVGASRRRYAHDVYAENGVLYSSDIYTGEVVAHDYTAVDSVYVLGSATTSTTFTHNAWPNGSETAVFTTDERSGAFVDAFDVRDPTEIEFLDKFRPDATYDSGSIPHNTHALGDHLATSWYQDGVIITDATRPGNLVEVGRYDTYPSGSAGGFDGCWGAYPFLPSGLLLASDINTGLYVFRPTYERGAYFEGQVLDSVSGQPLAGVTVDFDGRAAQSTTTSVGGDFATGIYEEGLYEVTFSKEGYAPRTVVASLRRAEVDFREVRLRPLNIDNLTLEVVDAAGDPISGAQTRLVFQGSSVGGGTGSTEGATASVTDRYDVFVGAWGYLTTVLRDVEVGEDPTTLRVVLEEGYYDDFLFDFDWSVTSTATAGIWERAVPVGASDNGRVSQLGEDFSADFGGECFATGNGSTATFADDVDNGVTSFTSPVIDLTGRDDLRLEFYYYFWNEGGNSTPDDALEVIVSNGATEVTVFEATQTVFGWTKATTAPLGTLIDLTAEMTVTFVTSDLRGSGHGVEAMIDVFSLTAVERPEISFAPQTGCTPLVVEAEIVDPQAGTDYTWTYEGAQTSTTVGDFTIATYTEPGTYDVALLVTDAAGGTATFTYPEVIEALPDVDAAFRTEVTDATVAFFNLSIGADEAAWDFGDGTTSDRQFVQHTYAASGTYTVTLTATGPCGTETVAQDVTVQVAVSTRDFAAATGLRVVENPATGQLRIASDRAEGVDVVLRDVVGRTARTARVGADGTTRVDVATLPRGMYFLSLASGEGGSAKVSLQ